MSAKRPKLDGGYAYCWAKVVARDESVSASGFPFPRIQKERQSDSSWRLTCETDEEDESTYNYEWWEVSYGKCDLVARGSPHVTAQKEKFTFFLFCVVSSTQSSSPSVRVSDLVEIGGESALDSWPYCGPKKKVAQGNRYPAPSELGADTGATRRRNEFFDQIKNQMPATVFDEILAAIDSQTSSAVKLPVPSAAKHLIRALKYHKYETRRQAAYLFSESLNELLQGASLPGLIGEEVCLRDAMQENDHQCYVDCGVYSLSPPLKITREGYPLLVCEWKSGMYATEEGALAQALRVYEIWRDGLTSRGLYKPWNHHFPSLLLLSVRQSLFLYAVATSVFNGSLLVSYSKLGEFSADQAATRSDNCEKVTPFLKRLAFGIKSLGTWIEQRLVFLLASETLPFEPVYFSTSYEYKTAIKAEVFEAVEKNSEKRREVIIKFFPEDEEGVISSYPIEIHNEIYDHGFTAQLFAIEREKRFMVIVLEKIAGCRTLEEILKNEQDLGETIIEQLESSLMLFHSRGWVHGDFRGPNILLDSNNKVKIVDLDWAGEKGKVVYPSQLNSVIFWPSTKGQGIQPQHDLYFLAGYKAKIYRMLFSN